MDLFGFFMFVNVSNPTCSNQVFKINKIKGTLHFNIDHGSKVGLDPP